MLRPGPRNLITDVPGIRVGQATDARAATGVTVIACDGEWVAAADVLRERFGWPVDPRRRIVERGYLVLASRLDGEGSTS